MRLKKITEEEDRSIIEITGNLKLLPKNLQPWAGQMKLAKQLTNGDFSIESEGSLLSHTFVTSHIVPAAAATILG